MGDDIDEFEIMAHIPIPKVNNNTDKAGCSERCIAEALAHGKQHNFLNKQLDRKQDMYTDPFY